MPRTARASLGNWCYHVLKRGNGRAEDFHKPADFDAFVAVLQPACERPRMRILAYCLMPNHFHLVLWPYGDGETLPVVVGSPPNHKIWYVCLY